ncbi:transporter substrate-binding domain-containing protein [Solihabitans fulvus]|uniref:Transporter substrate-binding domain-containing protein n=1 Tax=Solihabitans fulvus TaxID=1892852 RepID=A0A5B2WDQ1_9PSEU|nr:ABC transporter substrate-binding protein [Solihabitans fulvus]KAA2248752.1 transporter substrate-binding domain-containing protein [Solihabitans fulvus]
MPRHAGPFGTRLGFTRLAAIVAVTATMTITSGCGLLNGSSSNSGGGSTDKVEKGKVTIGILATADDAPVVLADKKGFFKEEGLNVEIKKFQTGPQALPALTSGELDFSLVNYVSYFQAVAQKTLDAKIVTDAYQGTGDSLVLMAKPDSGIKEPKDLAGKKVSVHAPGNINELLLRALLQDNSIDPNSVSFVGVKFPDIPAALASNQISAGVEVEPYITQAEQSTGAQPVFKIVTGSTDNIALSGYIATSKFNQDNPKTVAAFQRAMVKAQKAAADKSQLADVLPDLTGVDKQAVPLLNLGVFPTSLDATRLERVVTLMKTYGNLKTPIDVKSLIVATPNS